jgi:hypothetical protein
MLRPVTGNISPKISVYSYCEKRMHPNVLDFLNFGTESVIGYESSPQGLSDLRERIAHALAELYAD